MWCRYLTISIIVSISSVRSLEWQYHDNTELENCLKNFTATTRNGLRTRLYSIGTTKNKYDLWALELTASKKGRIGVPNIKLIGTVHGNEPVGRELLLHFMEYLRDNYRTDPTIAWLLDNTKIHFLPNLNPEGFALSYESMCSGEHVRNNGKTGQDLNRNFPDYFYKNHVPEEPETKAVRKWLSDVPFILSGALHGGALVANYPFDTVKEMTSLPTNPPSLTPDNDVFVHLATVYSNNHQTMHKGNSCNSSKIEGGITNGAAWYSVVGGMQDYNYAFHGCMELTLEISCCKYPSARDLPQLWQENKMALLKYCLEALQGVTGQIVDSVTLKPIAGASLRISGRNMTFRSFKTGEFWRLLLPGNYKLEISAKGYYETVVPFVVVRRKKLAQLTSLNIYLINSSISTTTTTEQITTEVTVEFVENISDGASTTDFSNIIEAVEDQPVARSLTSPDEESSALQNAMHPNYLYPLFLLILLL